MIDLIKRLVTAITKTASNRDVIYGYLLEILDLGRLDNTFEKRFEVVDEPHLARLTYTFSIGKALQAEKLGGLVD